MEQVHETMEAAPGDGAQNDGSSMLQLIDGDGNWCPDLTSQLTEWGFSKKGFDYWTVSILGCQSSGKSTLLNLLFKTHFAVMDSMQGRSQTTKGVWLGKCSDGKSDILVLDVEGTDGRERGEEQKAFERKSSLFSLALAEILLINLWTHDIGRWDAANYGLLRTVFELNLQLFAKSASDSKTLLLFVIRDHVRRVTPLERLKATLDADLNNLWTTITKPAEFAASSFRDFFDVEFTSLANKVLEEEDFIRDVGLLRDRFMNENNSEYLFRSAYAKDVPADGWPHYGESIWATIMESKDLDLPTQKEMLAIYRCDEILDTAFRHLVAQVEPIKEELLRPTGLPLSDFGQRLSTLLADCLAEYNEPASRYMKEVADRKREALQDKVVEHLYAVFSLQIAKLRDATLALLNDRIKARGLEGKDIKAAEDFGSVRMELEAETLAYFEKNVTDSVISGASWSVSADREDVRKRVTQRLAQLQSAHLDLLINTIEESAKKEILPPLNKQLEMAKNDMWPRVAELYNVVVAKSLETYDKRIVGYTLSEEDTEDKRKDVERRVFAVIKGRVTEVAKHMLYKMEKRFDEEFRLDAHGLPRSWTKSDDVAALFRAARASAYRVLDLCAIIRLRPDDFALSFLSSTDLGGEESAANSAENLKGGPETDIDPNIVVIGYDDFQVLKERFKKESEQAFVQALRDQQGNGANIRIPPFFWVVMLILGYNEFVTLLYNPLLLVFAIIVGVVAFTLWFLGLADLPIQVATDTYQVLAGEAKSWAVATIVNRFTGVNPAQTKPHTD